MLAEYGLVPPFVLLHRWSGPRCRVWVPGAEGQVGGLAVLAVAPVTDQIILVQQPGLSGTGAVKGIPIVAAVPAVFQVPLSLASTPTTAIPNVSWSSSCRWHYWPRAGSIRCMWAGSGHPRFAPRWPARNRPDPPWARHSHPTPLSGRWLCWLNMDWFRRFVLLHRWSGPRCRRVWSQARKVRSAVSPFLPSPR